MKKPLAILGLLIACSQPVFAQCNSCYTGAACPVLNQCNPCSSIRVIPIVKTCTQACAVVPSCNPCNPCATGAAVPINVPTIAVDPDYNNYACCRKNGFWKNFFSF